MLQGNIGSIEHCWLEWVPADNVHLTLSLLFPEILLAINFFRFILRFSQY